MWHHTDQIISTHVEESLASYLASMCVYGYSTGPILPRYSDMEDKTAAGWMRTRDASTVHPPRY